jgi:sugar lactone lactonase YvrE
MKKKWLQWSAVLLTAGFGSPAPAWSQAVYEAYTFVTLAGVPEAGPGFFDGTGNQARFRFPAGLTRDAVGNIYFADMDNHTIREISTAGVVTTIAGLAEIYGSVDAAGAAARFTGPGDVALDASGNRFIADSSNHAIRKISPGGVVSTIAGQPGIYGSADGNGGAALFHYPFGIDVNAAGILYVADSYNHTIRKITPDGTVTTLCGLAGTPGAADGPGTVARFKDPQGVRVDKSGTLFVSDTENHTIRKVTAAGVVTTVAGAAGLTGSADGTGSAARFNEPSGLGFGPSGQLFITEIGNHTVRQMTAAGVVTTIAGTAGSAGSDDGVGRAARFNFPFGVVATGNDLVVADAFNHTLRRITSNAVVTTWAGLPVVGGTSDGNVHDARFNYPQDVAVTPDGAVYVVDALSYTIRKIVGSNVTTFAGSAGINGSANGVGAKARFNRPLGLAAGNGMLYVADTDNHTIRKITSDGTVTTVAGLAGVSGSTDGTGSAARFNGPFRLTVDTAGVLYVADTGNHLIRKVTPAGIVTTLAGRAGVSGSADGVGTNAMFYAPEGIVVDSSGNAFVADDGNHTIRKITPGRVVSVFAGTTGTPGNADGVGTAASFAFPYGLAIDRNDNLYLADSNNRTIRKITPAASVTTMAGGIGLAANVDGTGSEVRFAFPAGLAVDNAGVLYVADSGNQSVRKGYAPLPDFPIVSPANGRAGTTRQLDVAKATTVSWSWTLVRCPATSSIQTWSSTVRNPTFTPDVNDLYTLRFQGTDSTERVAIRSLIMSASTTSVLHLGISPSSPAGEMDLDLEGPVGTSGRIEFSSDLASWNWLANFNLTNSPVRMRDPAPSPSSRFYRAIAP